MYYNENKEARSRNHIAVKKQHVLHIPNVRRSCGYPPRQAHAPYCTVTCGLHGSTTILHFVSQTARLCPFLPNQPKGLAGQEPEPSQATDMAVAFYFLSKVLVGRLTLLSTAFRLSNLRRQVPPRPHDARDPSSEGWNYGRNYCPII